MSNENEIFHDELRSAIERGCDLGSIRNIGKCRSLTEDLRLPIWKICLDIDENDEENSVDVDVFDLPEQNLIREDVFRLIHSSPIDENFVASKINDVETIVTFFCKKFNENYEKQNGWIDILKPLITLNYKNRSELYALFKNIRNRYVCRNCETDGIPYHLFRLLLLYHDPALCNFFDTRKITADFYAKIWIESLFSSSCSLNVVRQLWDVYFQHADQFFVFFLALVLLMFSKEKLFEMSKNDRKEIIEFLRKTPENLTTDDLEDFCSLANHYASKTPQSFRKEFSSCLFNQTNSQKAFSIYQTLCLPVSVDELLQANQLGGSIGVRFFIVDCRPAEQYNSKHLYTAFHLDANLLLEDPKEFSEIVDALFAAQKHAISAGSTAGGEHLCFMGSGRDEEDKYLRMVVAFFLQRNTKYVSVASGGFKILAKTIEDPSMITGTKTNSNNGFSIGSTIKQNIVEKLPTLNTQTTSLFNFISTAVKTKVKDYIVQTSTNETKNSAAKHVSKQDKVDKLYRQKLQKSVFSLDGDDDDEETTTTTTTLKQRNAPELVDIESWFLRSDILHKYECEQIDENNQTHPSLLLISSRNLFILRKLPDHKTMANLVVSRPLETISKITSKKNFPEIITFRYSTKQEEKIQSKTPMEFDKLFIFDAGDATKNIKLLIMKALNLFEDPNETERK